MKRIYVAFLGVVLALFALDNISSLAMRGDLGGSLANARSFWNRPTNRLRMRT